MKTLSFIGYLGMIGGLLGLLATGQLFSSSLVVICLQVVAFLLFIWARVTFGRRSYHLVADPTEGGLVTHGPYKYLRHPIYSAFCLFAGAGVAAHWSWVGGFCGGLILITTMVRIYCEEAMVQARYPEYEKYRASTWRMVPYVF